MNLEGGTERPTPVADGITGMAIAVLAQISARSQQVGAPPPVLETALASWASPGTGSSSLTTPTLYKLPVTSELVRGPPRGAIGGRRRASHGGSRWYRRHGHRRARRALTGSGGFPPVRETVGVFANMSEMNYNVMAIGTEFPETIRKSSMSWLCHSADISRCRTRQRPEETS